MVMITCLVGGPRDGEITHVSDAPVPDSIRYTIPPSPNHARAHEAPARIGVYRRYRMHREGGSRFDAFVYTDFLPLSDLPEEYSVAGIVEATFQRIFRRATTSVADSFERASAAIDSWADPLTDISEQIETMREVLRDGRSARSALRSAQREREQMEEVARERALRQRRIDDMIAMSLARPTSLGNPLRISWGE
jgi:hypothetical protein